MVTRYLFERRFGADDEAPAPSSTTGPELAIEPEPVALDPAIYTQDDLDRVRAEALSFGRKQGAAEAASSAAQRVQHTLERIAEGLAGTTDAVRSADAQQARDAAAIALAITRKLFPETSRRHGHTEIVGVIDAVIERIIDKPKLTVRVAESLQPTISGGLAAVAEAHGFAGQLSVVGERTMAEGDCQVVWAGGGAARDSAAIWREIEAAIRRTLGPIDPIGDSSADTGTPAADDVAVAATRTVAAPSVVDPADVECDPDRTRRERNT